MINTSKHIELEFALPDFKKEEVKGQLLERNICVQRKKSSEKRLLS